MMGQWGLTTLEDFWGRLVAFSGDEDVVLVGGTDTGVMHLVGKAMHDAGVDGKVPLLGISAHGAVNNRDKFDSLKFGRAVYQDPDKPSVDGAPISPHHSHFLFIDSGREQRKAWGSEIVVRAEIEQQGELKYILNTEPHGDHWTSNAYFDVPVVSHRGVRERMLETDMDAHVKRVATFGPEEAPLLDGYQANLPVITFEDDLKLFVGDHTFRLISMPGHTPYQLAVLIEEEGVVFTSDNVFCKVQMWTQEGDPDQWLQALESLRGLGAETAITS